LNEIEPTVGRLPVFLRGSLDSVPDQVIRTRWYTIRKEPTMNRNAATNLFTLAGGLALACGTLLSGSPDLLRGNGGMRDQMPDLGGIAVGNPGDTFSGNGRGPNLGSDQFGTSTGNAMYDLNGDGSVDEFDLAAMFDLLGTDESEGDFTGDGVVDGADLELLVRAW
jgi:hypothetical protein